MAVASLPRQPLDIQVAMHGLQRLVVAMRFVATPVGRDPRQGPMPTGHVTESMSYLHYYPQLQPNRRR